MRRVVRSPSRRPILLARQKTNANQPMRPRGFATNWKKWTMTETFEAVVQDPNEPPAKPAQPPDKPEPLPRREDVPPRPGRIPDDPIAPPPAPPQSPTPEPGPPPTWS